MRSTANSPSLRPQSRSGLGIRQQLFALQAATLGIVTAGAFGGWALSLAISQGAQHQSQQLNAQKNELAHISFDLLSAVPHTGQYLLTPRELVRGLIKRDIAGLRQFRLSLDQELDSLSLSAGDPALHRELESIRLLSVQVERRLQRAHQSLSTNNPQAGEDSRALLEQTVQDPAISLIRQHGDQLALLHDRLQGAFERQQTRQHQAAAQGLMVWVSVLVLAWSLGLTLAWNTANRLLNPLVQLTTLMRQPPDQLEARLNTRLFRSAPIEIRSLSESFQDLVAQVQGLLDQLEDQLRRDGLTNVGNRRLFDETLEREWRRSQRNAQTLSLLMLDIDHFKAFNDSYGHLEGDNCLREVARAIANQVRRSSDVVCRIGGEEFAVILPDTPAEAAFQLAQAISDAVDALAIPHAGSSVACWVTISVGVASRTADHPLRANELLAQADAALYRRKQQEGRHGVTQAMPPDHGRRDGEGPT